MAGTPPTRVAIDHDDYHAEHVGRTADGRQFFLTTPFVPGFGGQEGDEFVALYLFDGKGHLLEARIDAFGPRDVADWSARDATYARHLKELGRVTFERIVIEPFTIERFGTTFGLVTRPPEDDDGYWSVTVEPGNFMAFYDPWDSGEYDT